METPYSLEQETFSSEQVQDAIARFLEYGERSLLNELSLNAPGHRGYFAGNGWAAHCLRWHLEQLKQQPEIHS